MIMADLSKRIKELEEDAKAKEEQVAALKISLVETNKTIKKLKAIEKNISDIFDGETQEQQ